MKVVESCIAWNPVPNTYLTWLSPCHLYLHCWDMSKLSWCWLKSPDFGTLRVYQNWRTLKLFSLLICFFCQVCCKKQKWKMNVNLSKWYGLGCRMKVMIYILHGSGWFTGSKLEPDLMKSSSPSKDSRYTYWEVHQGWGICRGINIEVNYSFKAPVCRKRNEK